MCSLNCEVGMGLTRRKLFAALAFMVGPVYSTSWNFKMARPGISELASLRTTSAA